MYNDRLTVGLSSIRSRSRSRFNAPSPEFKTPIFFKRREITMAKAQCRSSLRMFGSRTIHTTSVVGRPAHDVALKEAKNQVNTLKDNPVNEMKLKIYGLFNPNDAQKAYIDVVNSLVTDHTADTAQTDNSAGVQYDGMKITRENKIFRIQLNRPKKKNAITWQMYDDIAKSLKEAAESDEYSIAVLTGTGDYYCSGNDLSNFTNVTPDKSCEMAKTGADVLLKFVDAFINFPKPLIALVNGPAVGIGVTTLGLCDTVYATDKASFHTPFSSLGQAPEACSSYIFPKIMGQAKASELLFFNRKISAADAKERNLVSEVIPHDRFEQETSERIKEYASFPPQSMRLSKTLTRSSEIETLKKVNEAECELLMERWQSEECINAIMAFFMRKSKL